MFSTITVIKAAKLYSKKEDDLKKQKESLTQIITNLSTNLYATKRSISEIFLGEKSLRPAYITLLDDAKKRNT